MNIINKIVYFVCDLKKYFIKNIQKIYFTISFSKEIGKEFCLNSFLLFSISNFIFLIKVEFKKIKLIRFYFND